LVTYLLSRHYWISLFRTPSGNFGESSVLIHKEEDFLIWLLIYSVVIAGFPCSGQPREILAKVLCLYIRKRIFSFGHLFTQSSLLDFLVRDMLGKIWREFVLIYKEEDFLIWLLICLVVLAGFTCLGNPLEILARVLCLYIRKRISSFGYLFA
jgi:hypothetical protein